MKLATNDAIGLDPKDVRWVLLTHLHTDHAGGLAHFPKAEHLVSRSEHIYAKGTRGLLRGYPSNRWPRWFNPTLIDMQPEPVSSFPASYQVTRAGDVRFVPTPGHTSGIVVVVTLPDLTYFWGRRLVYTGFDACRAY
jgi:glyoxylase-like metal-dependent hydrolase (beta-lactamase superfamily II)